MLIVVVSKYTNWRFERTLIFDHHVGFMPPSFKDSDTANVGRRHLDEAMECAFDPGVEVHCLLRRGRRAIAFSAIRGEPHQQNVS